MPLIGPDIGRAPSEPEYPDEYQDGDERDWEERDYEDELEQAMMECGYYPEARVCMLAGTEFCDWECPLADQLVRGRKAKKA